MSDDRRYASVPERITWTTGFRVPTDKAVLGALSTFANFKTGVRADMALPTLAERAGLRLRTVERSLQRLVADGWIVARRRHRQPTVYDICVDRLATHWMEAKLVEPSSDGSQFLSATSGGLNDASDKSLSAVGGGLTSFLSAVGGGLTSFLSATGGGPSPVRSDPLLVLDHKEPALRAVSPDQTVATPTAAAAPEAKVEDAKDPPRPPPQQLTFGPHDIRPPARDPNWTQRFADTIRSALRQTADRKKHG